MEVDHTCLFQAYKKEKNLNKRERILAVSMHKNKRMTVVEIAGILPCSQQSVTNWIRRFKEEDLVGLDDRPRTGRRPKVSLVKISRIISRTDCKTTPRKLREDIHKMFGTRYHITSVRRILHELGMSAKTAQRVHASKADIEEIRRWQRNAKERISRLEEKGFATAIQDEALFTYDPVTGRKYWSPTGEPLALPYNGLHQKVVVYGAIATDGRRFFRTYDKFNQATFLAYIKSLQRHFGMVTIIIMDRAPQHTARSVQKFIAHNPNIRIIHLPRATPELSAIEEYWHQAKRDVPVSEYYGTMDHMRRTFSEYLRTAEPNLDVMKYASRKSIVVKDF